MKRKSKKYCGDISRHDYISKTCIRCGMAERGTRGRFLFDFWRRIKKGPGCWLWMGRVHKPNSRDDRYGMCDPYWGEGRRAHRVAYKLTNGPIPKGLLVCHSCDTPQCCNPAHLFVGTVAQNMADKIRKGRSGRSKLHPSMIEVIRSRRRAGESYESLATDYGVKPGSIWRVCAGRTWKAVTS